MKQTEIKNLGIYIHIPFCVKKCPYCAFYSVKLNVFTLANYVKSVTKTIKKYSKILKKNNFIVDTIYFGGGTPSLLNQAQIYSILDTIKKYFTINLPEITLEFNPLNNNNTDFKTLRSFGVNRISIGMQSHIEAELKLLGRLHTQKDTIKTIDLIQNASINNISLDIMLNIPCQTQSNIKKTLEFCKNSNVQHISTYMLKIEKGTNFFKTRKKLNLPTEEKQCNNYLYTAEKLEEFGFIQYEISNFSKKNYESRHNLKYWNLENYLGIGPGAHSLINNQRFFYKNSIKNFIRGKNPIIESRNIDAKKEYIMLKLRLSKGVSSKEYYKKFREILPKEYFEKAKPLEKVGLLKIEEKERIRLTRNGMLVSNKVISEILFQ